MTSWTDWELSAPVTPAIATLIAPNLGTDNPNFPDNPTAPPGEIAFTDAYNIVKSITLNEYNFDMQLLRSESVALAYDDHGRIIRATHSTNSAEEITDITYSADEVHFAGALTANAIISDLRLSKIDDNAVVYGETLPVEIGIIYNKIREGIVVK